MFGKKKEEAKTTMDELLAIREELNHLKEKMNRLEELFQGKKQAYPTKSTISGFTDGDSLERLHRICLEIASKDASFKSDMDTSSMTITLYGDNKDVLHRRSMWLINKTGVQGLKYKIS